MNIIKALRWEGFWLVTTFYLMGNIDNNLYHKACLHIFCLIIYKSTLDSLLPSYINKEYLCMLDSFVEFKF